MRVLITFILCFISSFIYGQGLLINAGQFRVQAGHVVIAANGNWTNNGIVTCVAGSTIDFVGNARQSILGSNTTAFDNVTINNSHADGVWVGRDISINNVLSMTLGNFNLRDFIVTFSNAALLSSEGENKRVHATDAAGTEGNGTGVIQTTRLNPSGNVAGLGLNFTPSVALGNTVLSRGHLRQAGSGTMSAAGSVFRYYDIQPATMTTLTINNFYYWGGVGNPELNGHIETNLQMFQRVNYGGPTFWEPEATTITAASDYINSSTVNNAVGGIIRITLGSTTTPLPVELINFKAICDNNTNLLIWQTASEYNNDYFSVEKSPDGENFFAFTQVASQGNSSVIQNYNTIDFSPFIGTSYYRLHQFDIDGQDSFSEIISLNCKSDNFKEDILPISPSNTTVDAIVQGIPGISYQIKLTNVLGQVITNKTITLSDYQQSVRIYNSNLAIGMYYLVLQTETKNISKSLVINY